MRSVLNGLFVLFCFIAATAGADVVLDVDFDVPAYDTIAELQADGWTFTGQEGTNVPSGYDIRWQNGEKTLYLDGMPGDPNKPSAYKHLGQAIQYGSADFRWSHAASYSTSELQFLDGSGTVIFKVGLNDDTKIKFHNASGSVDITIPDNTAAPTPVRVEWNADTGSYVYDVSNGDFTGTVNFVNAGTPEAIRYILNNNTNGAREVFLYELMVTQISAPSGPYFEWTTEYTGSELGTIALYNFNEDQIYAKWDGHSAIEQVTKQNPASNTWMAYTKDDTISDATYADGGKFGWGLHNFGTADSNDFSRLYQSHDIFPTGADPNLSVEFWVNFADASGTQHLVDKQYSSNGGYQIWKTNSRMKFKISDGTEQLTIQTADMTFESGVWYHVGCTWNADDDTGRIYLNGRLVAETTYAGVAIVNSPSQEVYLGNRRSSSWGALNGVMDDFRVSSIAYEYAEPPHSGPYYEWVNEYDGTEPSTIAYWSLNEESITYGWSGTDVADVLPARASHDWGIRLWAANLWSFADGGKFGWGLHNPGGTTQDTRAQAHNGGNIFPAGVDPSLTVEAWVKFNENTSRQFIISKGSAWSSVGGYDLWYDAGELKFAVGNPDDNVIVTPNWTPDPNTWYHVAGTWNAEDDTARVYVNGNLLGSEVSPDLVIEDQSNRKTSIGSRTVSAYANLNGVIDEVRISNIAYEFAVPPVCGDAGTEIPGDISGPTGDPDCVVNMHDLKKLAFEWLASTAPTGPTPPAFFTAAPDNSVGFDADKLYPQGQLFPFSLYSVKADDRVISPDLGYTAYGPYYGTDQDAAFADAEAAGFKIIYRVGSTDPNFMTLPDPNIIATITAQVDAVKDSSAIAWWYITPEEPDSSATTLHYLDIASDAIRAADPLDRPIYTYHNNGAPLSRMEKTIEHLDIMGAGAYVNTTGHQDERILVKYVMEKELAAMAGTPGNVNATPIHAGWMSEDPADPNDDALIPVWTRHDIYLSVVSGAKGAVIWSGFRTRAGFERTFDDYFYSYGQIATELSGPLGNAVLFGEEKSDLSVAITSGPTTVSMTNPAYTAPSMNYLNLADTTGGRYLLMVNSANSAVSVNVSGLPADTVYIRDIFTEDAFTELTGGAFASTFDALGVKCFRIVPQPHVCGDEGTLYNPADISGPAGAADCVVNLYDFAEVASHWLDCSLLETDPACN